ncbi:MAG: RNA polymerase subunit sigma-24 [Clostridiales bacterium]|jgi:DNA-directed RNA polymerase specialized sigma24 family protein|nr:RNA polymerase subunit sigma-24 [Clostridiales bacterium]
MKFNNKTEWAYNKFHPDKIVYIFADGIVEVTLEQFLKESPDRTKEDFYRLKAASDDAFHEWDKLDVTEARHSEPLDEADGQGKCSVKSPEDLIVERIDRLQHEAYLETLKPLAWKALDKLTAVQRRRYLLHFGEGLTTRRIAEIEGVRHQSVVESLQAADKKIKKIVGQG